MKFAERILVLLALIALGLRWFRAQDGATVEIIALPLLALFYLTATPFLLYGIQKKGSKRHPLWNSVPDFLSGLGIAYCIISLLLFTLGKLPRLDMLENCGLILFILGFAFFVRYRNSKSRKMLDMLFRIGLLLVVIISAGLLNWGN